MKKKLLGLILITVMILFAVPAFAEETDGPAGVTPETAVDATAESEDVTIAEDSGDTPAFAAEEADAVNVNAAVWDGSVDISWYTEQPLETADYYVDSPAKLAGLAYIVNGRLDADKFPVKSSVSETVAKVVDGAESDGKTVSGLTAESFWNKATTHIDTEGGGSGVTEYNLYVGKQAYDFAGKTIHLTCDMDMGGKYTGNKASGPNWMPIGGRFPADPGKLKIIVDANFNGCLDGGGHTVSNLYCNRQSGGNYMWSQGVGLIGALGDLYDDASYKYGHSAQPESVVKEEILKGWTAGVRNLCVGNSNDSATFHGYIYANRMVGGIVGRAGDAIIENCANFTTLSTTDHKGTAGIIGATDGKGSIRNCYNAGYIHSSSNGCPCGGIVGSNTFNIYNCYNVGQINVPDAKELSEGIGSHFGGSYVVDNCYSLNGTWTDSREDTTKNGYYFGNATDLVINTEVRSSSEMTAAGFVKELNAGAGDAFVAGRSGINNGYPILFWQAGGMPSGTATVSAAGGGGQGSVLVHVPVGGYMDRIVLQAGESAQVPVGTVVTMEAAAQAPNRLEHFTAGSAELRADYYAVTAPGSVSLGGSFIQLTQGSIILNGSSSCYLGVSKNGTVVDKNGKAWTVSDQIVRSGDAVFQDDVLTVKAVLKDGVTCSDPEQEYTGRFVYTYRGGSAEETNMSGVYTVKKGTSSLQISAQPRTQEKNWSTYADTRWCADPDNIRGTYTIHTAQELAGLVQLVNSGNTFAGAVVKLGNDISLKNPDDDGSVRLWTPIGQSAKISFQGTFDGKNHTISGVTVNSAGSLGGLFGFCNNAAVKDLTVSGRIISKGNAGGIVSSMIGGSITGCTSRVNVDADGDRAGGIAGQVSEGAKISTCINRGSVSGSSKVGGIAGEFAHTANLISQCANFGEVSGTDGSGLSSCTGGIAGYVGSKIDKCANYGSVTSVNACVGGIAGFTYANTKATETKYKHSSAVYNSCNQGAVKGTTATVNTFVGGLVGRSDYVLMKNCYNTGSVTTADPARTYLGTVCGGFYKSVFSNVSDVYYSENGSPTTSYTKSGGIIRVDQVNPSLSYFKTTHKDLAAMQTDAFTRILNSVSKDTFQTVSGGTPQLAWLSSVGQCIVTFTGDWAGTMVTVRGGSVDLPACEQEGYKYVFHIPGNDDWNGTGVTGDLTVSVTKEKIRTAFVVFTADGHTVDVNRDGKVDKKDYIEFYTEDGSGTPYRYISAQNIVTSGGGLTEVPNVNVVAGKAGHDAAWNLNDSAGVSYWSSSRNTPLGTHNITVRAVYTQRQLPFTKDDDGQGTIRYAAEITSANGGYYFLAPQSKGTVTVKSGATATLDGSNGPFTNVRFVVEKGGKLTLKNMVVKTDPARLAGKGRNAGVLEIIGGSSRGSATTLKFSGYNSISGTNDGGNGTDAKGKRIICPAVDLKGYVKFTQASKATDTLYITAAMDSPEINLQNKATMEVAGGVVEVYKKERLGANGGMIYGGSFDYKKKTLKGSQKGNLTVSGGSLISVSESNNVFAACVNQYKQTGGQAIFYANEASQYRKGHKKYIGTDVAIYAKKMTVTGGSLCAKTRTHQDKLSDKVRKYSGAKCIGSGNGFSSKYKLVKVNTSKWNGKTCTVKVGGKVCYKGAGNNVSYKIGTLNSFNTKKSTTDKYIYLWVPKGRSTKVSVQ